MNISYSVCKPIIGFMTSHWITDVEFISLLFTTYVIIQWLIYSKYYSVTDMLNELCIPDFVTVVIIL